MPPTPPRTIRIEDSGPWMRWTLLDDRDAFGELYQHHVDRVTRYVGARIGARDRDAIPDLVQDAFCDALADPTLVGPDVIGSFLRLAARACTRHNWSHRRYVRAAYTVYEDQRTANHTSPHTNPPATLGRITFAHALSRLTADQRRAIQLRLLEDYPRDIAAHLMGRSVSAMKALEQRALRNLQNHLTPPRPPSPYGEAHNPTAGTRTALISS